MRQTSSWVAKRQQEPLRAPQHENACVELCLSASRMIYQSQGKLKKKNRYTVPASRLERPACQSRSWSGHGASGDITKPNRLTHTNSSCWSTTVQDPAKNQSTRSRNNAFKRLSFKINRNPIFHHGKVEQPISKLLQRGTAHQMALVRTANYHWYPRRHFC